MVSSTFSPLKVFFWGVRGVPGMLCCTDYKAPRGKDLTLCKALCFYMKWCYTNKFALN